MKPHVQLGTPAHGSARPTSSPTTMPITAVNATCSTCGAFFIGPRARDRAKRHAEGLGHAVHVETISTMHAQPR